MFQPENVFVTPGAGRKVPLPLPGGGSIPAEGKSVPRTLIVERLIASKDLVVTEPESETLDAEAAQLTTEAATLRTEAAASKQKGA